MTKIMSSYTMLATDIPLRDVLIYAQQIGLMGFQSWFAGFEMNSGSLSFMAFETCFSWQSSLIGKIGDSEFQTLFSFLKQNPSLNKVTHGIPIYKDESKTVLLGSTHNLRTLPRYIPKGHHSDLQDSSAFSVTNTEIEH